jgi:asparagine synthase (glutamine-hydrolysing)
VCGICGWVGTSPSLATADIGLMLEALRNRGPDDCGLWSEGEGGAVLAHTRLSIIDVCGSKQPMTNEDGTVVVTYNGEIYNFPELRRLLLARGHTFRTRGDTEVLPHLYEEYGAGMVPMLDGMFAFGLYDRRRRSLLLARDRVGIKPLYYWHDSSTGALLFASDMSALLSNRLVPRQLEPRALAQYLHFGFVVHPQGWLHGVAQVEPGELVQWERGGLRHTKYYAWRYEPRGELYDPELARAEGQRRLADSVRSQLVADVPLGSFLSGGLDSATVTGFAQEARQPAGDPIRSFTVRFGTPDFDESARARAAARDLATRHAEIDGQELRFDRPFLDRLVLALGEPFADTSALATYRLCLEARPHIKVALGGDGGDEIFFGYSHLWKQQWARRLGLMPRGLRRMLRALANKQRGTAMRRVHKYTHLSLLDGPGLIIDWSRRWEWPALATLLAGDRFEQSFPDLNDPFPEVRAIIGSGECGGFPEQQSRFHLLVALPCDGLHKIDRMSMAHGLEVRVPMLSNPMLEYAEQLPLSMRKWGQRTKEPLRTIAEGLAPTLKRPAPKRGLEFPLDAWMRRDLARQWREWELTARLAEIGFVATEVDSLVAQYDGVATSEGGFHAATLAMRVFDLMLLALWTERYRIRL